MTIAKSEKANSHLSFLAFLAKQKVLNVFTIHGKMRKEDMVKSAIDATKKYVLGSIGAYMREDKNLNWIVGILRSSGLPKSGLQKIFDSYRGNYASNSRFMELDNEVKIGLHIVKTKPNSTNNQ